MYLAKPISNLRSTGLVVAWILSICGGCRREIDRHLFAAASGGDIELVKSLMKSGADVNAREVEGETPLMYAAVEGRTAVVLLLLRSGADVNAVSENGETALGRAAYAGETECVKVLILNGADIEKGGARGTTPLMYASSRGHADTVEALLEKGAKPNAEDQQGYAPLIYAASQGAPKQVLEMLIAAGADVEHKDKRGKTAEMFAAENGYKDTAEFLRQASKKNDEAVVSSGMETCGHQCPPGPIAAF